VNKRVKKLWVEALRSGEYEQTTGRLRYMDAFCCLGVLCDLYVKETGKIETEVYRFSEGVLPIDVADWSGFRESNPYIGKHLAIDHNDGLGNKLTPKTFTQISNLIQRYL